MKNVRLFLMQYDIKNINYLFINISSLLTSLLCLIYPVQTEDKLLTIFCLIGFYILINLFLYLDKIINLINN